MKPSEFRRISLTTNVSLLIFSSALHAQQLVARDTAVETREVVAEGRAAIGVGGLIAARRAATAQALRAAVEKTTGVYVSARTLTQNYQLVRDQVVTRSDGYATLKQVLREVDGTQEVSVTVRALVSLRPLALHLKALGLTRAWRIRVPAGAGGKASDPHEADEIARVEGALTEAGFVVVSTNADADVLVRIQTTYSSVADLPLDTAAGPMTMHTVRSDICVRATRSRTGEEVAALSAAAATANVGLVTARADAADQALARLAPSLVEALLLLPARDAQPVQLVVSHVASATDAARLEDALNALPGVRSVRRRSYEAGSATYELEVLSESLSRIARDIEESEATRSFHLKVHSDTTSKITASAALPPLARRQATGE